MVPALTAIVRLFTGEHDKIMIQPPVYPEFYDVNELSGRRVAENNMIERDGRWEIDFEDFEEKAKDPLTKMFILCNPHNPLGKVWTKAELGRMLSICFENGVLVVSDEIHSDLIFHGKKHIPAAMALPGAENRVITCLSATKTFNLAGLQASATVFPNREMKDIFDRYWGSWISTGTMPSALSPWKLPFVRARSGWSRCSIMCPGILILLQITARTAFRRSARPCRTPRTLYGWTAGNWGLTMRRLRSS